MSALHRTSDPFTVGGDNRPCCCKIGTSPPQAPAGISLIKRGDRGTPRCRRLHRERNFLRQQAGGQDDQHGADCSRCDPPSEVVSQAEIDTKAFEKNRAKERADHPGQCIAYEAVAADEPTREPPGDEPDPDLRDKSLLVDFCNRVPVNDHANR